MNNVVCVFFQLSNCMIGLVNFKSSFFLLPSVNIMLILNFVRLRIGFVEKKSVTQEPRYTIIGRLCYARKIASCQLTHSFCLISLNVRVIQFPRQIDDCKLVYTVRATFSIKRLCVSTLQLLPEAEESQSDYAEELLFVVKRRRQKKTPKSINLLLTLLIHLLPIKTRKTDTILDLLNSKVNVQEVKQAT